jgi:hypothetical protein
MQIGSAQWRTLTELSFRRTESDIALALRGRFENSTEKRVAISIATLSDDQLASFIHGIVEVGRRHGFVLRSDLYALVEAAAMLGPRNLISEPVLSNPNLTAGERVRVMVDLCNEARALGQKPV